MNTMENKTAMQQMLEWTRKTFPMELDTPRMIEDKIESLLKVEEQQIKDAVIFGINHGSDECRVFGLDARPYGAKQGALYINQTYRTNGK
jgi:hypothetical protein